MRGGWKEQKQNHPFLRTKLGTTHFCEFLSLQFCIQFMFHILGYKLCASLYQVYDSLETLLRTSQKGISGTNKNPSKQADKLWYNAQARNWQEWGTLTNVWLFNNLNGFCLLIVFNFGYMWSNSCTGKNNRSICCYQLDSGKNPLSMTSILNL